jgi:hypothetical protein
MSRTLRTAMAAALAAASLAATAACLIVLDDTTTDPSGTRTELHRVIAFKPGGALALRNLDGDLEIRGWDREEVEITFESDGRSPRGRWSVLGSGRPRFEVEEAGGRLSVRTRWEGDDSDVYPVHGFLNVPRSIVLEEAATQRGNVLIADIYGRAKISILDGDLTVENYSGPLEASVSRGRIRAEILDLRPEDIVRLSVRTGDVSLALEPEADARVQAESLTGVTGDAVPSGTGKAADFKLGAGAASIAIKAPGGRVEVVKIR